MSRGKSAPHSASLHAGYDEIVGVIAMFEFLNRWNDTFATPLEDEPLEFAEKHLAAHGWSAEKHLR